MQWPEDDGQPDLFAALDEARRLRDDGMRTAEHSADVRVRSAIDSAIDLLIASRRPWSSDDVRKIVDPVASPNILGARINAAARAGRIVRIGFVQTTRPEAHGRHVAQWVAAEQEAA